MEFVVEGWLCVVALSPACGRPSPDFGRGATERSDVGERARMARFPIFHTTNSVRSSNTPAVRENGSWQRLRADLLRPLLAEAAQLLAQLGALASQDRDGQERRVACPGPANCHRGNRNPTWHLHDGEQ